MQRPFPQTGTLNSSRRMRNGPLNDWRLGHERSGSRPPAATPLWQASRGTTAQASRLCTAHANADRAMNLLKKAVSMVFRDPAIYRNEPALDGLRPTTTSG